MKTLLFATTILGSLALGGSAFAQSVFDFSQPGVGKEAGTFMLRTRAIGVIPENNSSSVSGIGGTVSATAQAAPEFDLSYFLTDHIAFELIAASTRHELSVKNSAVGSNLDVGSVWALPPTLTVQYHFMPHSKFSPYVGAGINVTFWYGSSPANPPVTHFSVGNNVGAAIQAGFDYNVAGHWFLNVDVKQLFLNTDAHVDALGTTVKARTSLDPIVVGAGIGYRF
ncbi:MAG TPA: OmpW family outer membrane protein [Rhodopila sp.]|uniref:OmpW/AlkL family protein n=1 Tax=Rhodopila sp. TaxID=2480087 RepID=UPI002BDC045B|nr:OmpW family outer membrane protein [Rhodopila sp.]HVY16293.1 OmpW family outer membrane protein [Rhodopila sp.]